MMEKKILLSSNTSVDFYKNTLASFKNIVPSNYLPPHKKWKLGLDRLSFNCKFVNSLTSVNNEHPAIIMVSKSYLNNKIGRFYLSSTPNIKSKPLELNSFLPSHLYFLDSSVTYSLRQINEKFREETLKNKEDEDKEFIGFPTMYNEEKEHLRIGQFFDSNMSLSNV